jgi:hypothetical protein
MGCFWVIYGFKTTVDFYIFESLRFLLRKCDKNWKSSFYPNFMAEFNVSQIYEATLKSGGRVQSINLLRVADSVSGFGVRF